MKNHRQTILMCLLVIICFICLNGCYDNESDTPRVILSDSQGHTFYDSSEGLAAQEYSAFVDIVSDEIKEISLTDKKDTLYIKTTFNTEFQKICAQAYEASALKNTPFASVITSVDGRILCAFSGGSSDKNYTVEKTQPYSSVKPLSVYTPALEKGTINWASTFVDSPVKQTMSDDGVYEDWPVNGNGYYTNKNTSIRDCIKYSLNTTAVRCLQDTGVAYCMDFISDKFGIDVKAEAERAAISGEEEVLHNIGLGYLEKGVSPVDMAGYYQIFATGGKYTAPFSILEITDKDGIVLYVNESVAEAVISEETAYIMNALLRSPLERGGTAEMAYIEDVPLGGKTGTGTDYTGNWFVCFSPEYSVSIWHGRYTKNICTEIFSDISEKLIFDKSKNYPECEKVKMRAYCEESGEGFSVNCSSLASGYFVEGTTFDRCSLHS